MISLTSAERREGKWEVEADHTVFIVHSFTNVQNKNQTIKGKTSERELWLSALFSSPGSLACSGQTLQQSHATALHHGAMHSPGFRGSGLATSRMWPDINAGRTWSVFLWVDFDCFLLWISTETSPAGGGGSLLCLQAVIRRRNALAEAMSFLIPPTEVPVHTNSLFLRKEAAQLPR